MSAARLLALLPILLAPRLAHAQFESQKLTPSVAIQNGHYGAAIDIDASSAIACSPRNTPQSGRVYFLEHDGSSWLEVAQFSESPSLTSADFGYSNSLSGDYAVVGAPFLSHNSTNPGQAYVYERQGGVWSQVAHLTPSDGAAEDDFGYAVALDGETILVGSRKAGPIDRAGAVYVFERVAGSWIETQKLSASNAAINDRFGTTVDLDGTTAVIGAPFEDNASGNKAGRVYVFQHDGASWNEVQKIKEADGEPSGLFGRTLALDGDRLLVGTNESEVYVLERSGANFAIADRITAKPGYFSIGFGVLVDLSGDRILVSAPGSWIASDSVGSAQLFELGAEGWELENMYVASDRQDGDNFGLDVAIDGEKLLIGMITDDDAAFDAGAVYAFDVSTLDTDLYCFCDSRVAPCGNPVWFAGCQAGQSGRGARLESVGNTSVAADELVLIAGDLPWNNFALVFMGSTQPEAPFGNGLLCVGAGGTGLFRFPVQNTGTGGYLSLGPGIIAHATANFSAGGQVQAGDQWNFQIWYRDTNGYCGEGFNTSNAVTAVFGN